MKIALFYDDGLSVFEIVLIALFFRNHDLPTLALEEREYRREENQRFCVDQVIQKVDLDSIDLLIIPGGDPTPFIKNQELKDFIGALISKNKKVAAICGGRSPAGWVWLSPREKMHRLVIRSEPSGPRFSIFRRIDTIRRTCCGGWKHHHRPGTGLCRVCS